MFTLVGVLVREHGAPVRASVDPAMWWYLARASGLLAWGLLGAAVLGGLTMSTRLAVGGTRSWTQGLHEFLGVLAVVFTAIHLACVRMTSQLGIGLLQLLVPFTRAANPMAQGCGALAVYLLAAVMLTSWARVLLSWRCWRGLHLLAFPLFLLACVHSVLAGSDTAQPPLRWTGLGIGAVLLALGVLRLRRPQLRSQLRRVPSPVPAAIPPPRPQPLPPPPAGSTAPQAGLRLLISQTTWEADNVLSLRLVSPDGHPLPGWEPGAHVELVLPSGRRRPYSLCGDPGDHRYYRIAVLQVPQGRGGSVEVHTSVRAGQLVSVRGPHNHFPLVSSSAYLFLAGGIGITAILPMAVRVAAAGGDWRLIYTGRSRRSMAFVAEVMALDADRVQIMPRDEGRRADLDALIAAAPAGTAVYCCGPDRLLRAVRQHVATRPDLSLHSERFTGEGASGGQAFSVELRRSGRVIEVPAGRTLLQAVRDVLPTVPAGCEQGVCGACRTLVLGGEPDHRDELLSDQERAAGAMLICVSRARSERLTLDL
jgi:ferredoxin-NADP reductase/DMSO/TMAO reductase YedYZ heme-binding membrane subunit